MANKSGAKTSHGLTRMKHGLKRTARSAETFWQLYAKTACPWAKFRNRSARRISALACFMALALPACTMKAASTPAAGVLPSPTPFTISDAELKKITKDQIAATLKHVMVLYKDALLIIARQSINLENAAGETATALTMQNRSLANMNDLQEEIRRLKKHDEDTTAALNKANKALWWYRLRFWGAWIVFGLGVLACIVLAFLKFTGRLSLSAAKIAAKF